MNDVQLKILDWGRCLFAQAIAFLLLVFPAELLLFGILHEPTVNAYHEFLEIQILLATIFLGFSLILIILGLKVEKHHSDKNTERKCNNCVHGRKDKDGLSKDHYWCQRYNEIHDVRTMEFCRKPAFEFRKSTDNEKYASQTMNTPTKNNKEDEK